ncbi:unnamed protein product, partial [Closterium sp. NIES-54]
VNIIAAHMHRLPRSCAESPTVFAAGTRDQSYCGLNDEGYTLTFIDSGTRYVWNANMHFRSRAHKIFCLWLAHAQRQSGKKLKIWQTNGPAKFRSKELHDYLAQKGIAHQVSLPYAHPQQGVIEHTSRTLMTKVRELLKHSKIPPSYCPCAMHHVVQVHNLLSTTAIMGNLLTGAHSKEWREAMDAEIKALVSRDTWVLIDCAAIRERRVLSGKWVYRVKNAADATIEHLKARWVIRGYDQRHGIDFNQTFAPLSRHTSVKILRAIDATRHLLSKE